MPDNERDDRDEAQQPTGEEREDIGEIAGAPARTESSATKDQAAPGNDPPVDSGVSANDPNASSGQAGAQRSSSPTQAAPPTRARRGGWASKLAHRLRIGRGADAGLGPPLSAEPDESQYKAAKKEAERLHPDAGAGWRERASGWGGFGQWRGRGQTMRDHDEPAPLPGEELYKQKRRQEAEAQRRELSHRVGWIFRNVVVWTAMLVTFILSFYATMDGLFAISATYEGAQVSWWTWDSAVVIALVAMLTALMFLSIDMVFRKGARWQVRLICSVFYVFLMLWSVGFGYGYYWKQFAAGEAGDREATSARADVLDFMSLYEENLESVEGAINNIAAQSEAAMRTENRVGGSCGVPSGAGRGPLYAAREEVTTSTAGLTEGIKSDWLQPSQQSATGFKRELDALLREYRAAGGDVRAREVKRVEIQDEIRQFAVKANAGLERNRALYVGRIDALASPLRVESGAPGFTCYDPVLAGLFDEARRQLASMPALAPPDIRKVEGNEAVPVAITKMWTSVINLFTGGELLMGARDILTLLAALLVDLSIVFITFVNQPRRATVQEEEEAAREQAADQVTKWMAYNEWLDSIEGLKEELVVRRKEWAVEREQRETRAREESNRLLLAQRDLEREARRIEADIRATRGMPGLMDDPASRLASELVAKKQAHAFEVDEIRKAFGLSAKGLAEREQRMIFACVVTLGDRHFFCVPQGGGVPGLVTATLNNFAVVLQRELKALDGHAIIEVWTAKSGKNLGEMKFADNFADQARAQISGASGFPLNENVELVTVLELELDQALMVSQALNFVGDQASESDEKETNAVEQEEGQGQ